MLSMVPRVFALGRSNLSKYLTYHLASHPSQPPVPDVVLVLGSEQESKAFVDFNKSSITVKDYSKRFGVIYRKQIMATAGAPKYADGKLLKLSNLILSGTDSLSADKLLSNFQRSISPSTNILLLDSNRSVVENIYKNVFKHPSKRPNIYQCISTHRLFGQDNYEVNSLGTGTLTIAKVPKNLKNPNKNELNFKLDTNIETQPDLIKMLIETSGVHPVFVSFTDFEVLQLESLIVKAAIEPLTVIFDCLNGELLHVSNITLLLTKIVDETTKVLTAAFPHILENPYATIALDNDRLVNVILNVLKESYGDMSRLKFDISAFKKELDENANSYLAELASKHKIMAPLNTMYAEQIIGKHSLELYKSNYGFEQKKNQS